MVTIEIFFAYTLACILNHPGSWLLAPGSWLLAPGPDNILAISRGRIAAFISSLGAGAGLMVHVLAAALGLAVLIQTSELAFSLIKGIGALYLIWLGVKAIRSKDLISFVPSSRQSHWSILTAGFLTNVLNPKPAIFILAFIPQFVSPDSGSVLGETLLLGACGADDSDVHCYRLFCIDFGKMVT